MHMHKGLYEATVTQWKTVVRDCNCMQQTCNRIPFKMVVCFKKKQKNLTSKKGTRSVTTQSVTVFKATLMCQDGDKTSIRASLLSLFD